MCPVKRFSISIALAAGIFAAPSVQAESHTKESKFISIEAAKLKWSDAPTIAPGAKLTVIEGDLKAAAPFTFRVKIPQNTKVGVHTHPTVERVTVLTGTLYFATGDKFDTSKAKAYKAGDAFIVPAGMPMYAYTKQGETVLQVHGTGPWGMTPHEHAAAPGKTKK